MPLVNCTECEKEISVTASSCPSCGSKKPFKGKELSAKESADMSYKERRSFQKGGGTLLLSMGQKISLGLVLSVIVLGVFKCSSNTDNSSTKQADLNKALNQLENAMKDPRKVRLLECEGINPWDTKPANWTPPTKSECEKLHKVLGEEAKSRGQ